MADSNRKLNQSVDLRNLQMSTNDNFPQLTEDSYLATEGDIDSIDHRNSARSLNSKVQQKTIQVSSTHKCTVDVLEFLRQILKVTEQLDSAGMQLKYVFGNLRMEDEKAKPPKATKKANYDRLV